MRLIREIYRLALVNKLGTRQIAKSCNISPGTVSGYLNRLPDNLLDFKALEAMDDDDLEELVSAKRGRKRNANIREPDWEYIHRELRKKGVTIALLWDEYKTDNPDGYQSSQFYEKYKKWRQKLDPSMRQNHKAGEKVFVDYAGMKVDVYCRYLMEIREAEIFVGSLGASSYTYAEATWDQTMRNWLDSHVRMYRFFGGVPEITIPDNLKAGVTKPCRYDPVINKSYHDLSVHYGTTIIPARPKKPKDKAKVEVAVQIVERRVLAPLRNRKFLSIEELNEAIGIGIAELNEAPMQKTKISRSKLFETLDGPALKPLPDVPYRYAEWKRASVNIDYHVELDKHYYSVPYRYIKEYVEMRHTNRTVEIFFKNKRIASHVKSGLIGHHTTLPEHMPESHRGMEWSPSRLINWAEKIGGNTKNMVTAILDSRKHVEQGYRSCLGILRLSKHYSPERLEKACKRAMHIGASSFRNVNNILKNGLDKHELEQENDAHPIQNPNIRGKKYYQSERG